VVIGTLVLTGAHLRESPAKVLFETATWAPLGMLIGHPINGFPSGSLIAYVTWSLQYEWMFYASLIITALFARNRHVAWAFPALGLIGSLAAMVLLHATDAKPSAWSLTALFSVGMLSAALRPMIRSIDFDRAWYSAAAAALVAVVLCLFRSTYSAGPTLLLGGAFFLIANGASLFGLLNTRAARRLGDVSFGIYLLQGFVLAALFATPAQRAFALASPLNHWVLIAISASALVTIATVAHVMIERTGVDLGKHVLDRIQGRPRI
jgi:peptidoglycan/LPS O-acetylase OafA/YrhL